MAYQLHVFFLLFSTLIPFSNGSSNSEFDICSSPSSCGPITGIRYPFWVKGSKPKYCGQQNFKLHCGDTSDYPRMPITSSGKRYRVHNITYAQRGTIVIDEDRSQTCRALQKADKIPNNDDQSKPFILGPTVGNLTLFLGCQNKSTPNRFQNLSFPCYIPDDVNISVYYWDKGAKFSRCQTNFTFPVSQKALDNFMNNKKSWELEKVLVAQFEVQFMFPNFKACMSCRDSGGVCGSLVNSLNVDDFECYHPGKRQYLGLILGLGITGGAVLIILALVAYCCKKFKFSHPNFASRSPSMNSNASDLESGSLYFGVSLFSYKDLQEATNHFDESRALGEGGFGRVYYGKLKDGREVAVKQLYERSYRRVEQFMNEVQILTRLRHKNLVSLYGCTSPRSRELLLVYEYISNGTVADHLYSEKESTGYLPWETRMRIAIETASALSYLHASDIIHRDVKTNNILLDANFSVKVADFGLSRLFPTDVTHVSTTPQGTPGYLDPEYHHCYQLTVKSDVYSFGVVLIELISSLPVIDMNREKHEIKLSNYAANRIERGAFEELVDPRLGFGSDYKIRRITTLVADLAFQCLQDHKELRPTMDEVSEVLKRIQNSDYDEELGKEDDEVRSHGTMMDSPSPTDLGDDGTTSLMSIHHHRHHNQQQIHHASSPNSVMYRWGSRSTNTSSTSKQGSNQLFYSISN